MTEGQPELSVQAHPLMKGNELASAGHLEGSQHAAKPLAKGKAWQMVGVLNVIVLRVPCQHARLHNVQCHITWGLHACLMMHKRCVLQVTPSSKNRNPPKLKGSQIKSIEHKAA